MLIPVGAAQVNWRLGGAGLPLGAEVTLAVTVNDFVGTPADAATAAGAAWADNIMENLCNQVTFVNTHIKYGPTATGPAADQPYAVNGGIVDDPSPPNISVLVRKNTALGGRSGRGRMYIPGIGEGSTLTGGVLRAGDVGALQADLDAMHAQLIAANLRPLLLHSPDAPIADVTEVTSFTVDTRVATQRRRLRR